MTAPTNQAAPAETAEKKRHQVNSTIDEALAGKLASIKTRRGVEPATMGRLALEFYVPLYEAGQGNPQHIDLLAQIASAIEERPEIKTRIEKFIRDAMRRAAA